MNEVERIIFAGFGGQGILFMGKLLAQMMTARGKCVTYYPSYGAEVRGGTANCHVQISDREIYSPIIASATMLGVMNQPSFERFVGHVAPGGVVVVNTSLVTMDGAPGGVRCIGVKASELATDLGNVKIANMVMLGACNRIRNLLPREEFLGHLAEFLGGRKKDLLELNAAAIKSGEAAVAGQM